MGSGSATRPAPHGRTCSGAAVTGHVPAWHRAARTAGKHRPSGPLPAQLLFAVVFPNRRAAITRKHCGKREERVKGLAQEGHKTLGCLLAASGGSLNGSREPADALCARRRGQEAKALHLADLCDLGLRVHPVEPQTVFELPSVTINVGDVRACNNPSARALQPYLASLSPPNLTQRCLWAGLSVGKPPEVVTMVTVTSGWGRWRVPGAWESSSAPGAPRYSHSQGRVCAQDYLHHVFCCISGINYLNKPS